MIVHPNNNNNIYDNRAGAFFVEYFLLYEEREYCNII